MDSIAYTIKGLILLGILTGGDGITIPYISDGALERTLEHSPSRRYQQSERIKKGIPFETR